MVLFSGKGGVGKTTLASAFAYSCARRGKKTLLIELNVKDRLSALFGSIEKAVDEGYIGATGSAAIADGIGELDPTADAYTVPEGWLPGGGTTAAC